MNDEGGYLMVIHACGADAALHDGKARGRLEVWDQGQMWGHHRSIEDFIVLKQGGRTVWLDRSTRSVHAGMRFVVVFKGERQTERLPGRNCVEGCASYTGCQIVADFPIRKES